MTDSTQDQSTSGRKDYTLVWIIVGLVAVCACALTIGMAGLGFIAFFGARSQTFAGSQQFGPIPTAPARSIAPPSGQVGVTIDVPVTSKAHVKEGSQITYNSDPPAGGPHYPSTIEAGFYTEPVEDGTIVHNQEHGYVVIWYDCSTLKQADCDELQKQIEDLIASSSATKLIGMPRAGMGHIIALSSWGKLAYLDQFDAGFINGFIRDNLNHAPEPGTP